MSLDASASLLGGSASSAALGISLVSVVKTTDYWGGGSIPRASLPESTTLLGPYLEVTPTRQVTPVSPHPFPCSSGCWWGTGVLMGGFLTVEGKWHP